MPLIQVTLVKGRPPEQIRSFIHLLYQAAVDALGAADSAIRVQITEVEPSNWAVGDVTKAEMGSTSTAR